MFLCLTFILRLIASLFCHCSCYSTEPYWVMQKPVLQYCGIVLVFWGSRSNNWEIVHPVVENGSNSCSIFFQCTCMLSMSLRNHCALITLDCAIENGTRIDSSDEVHVSCTTGCSGKMKDKEAHTYCTRGLPIQRACFVLQAVWPSLSFSQLDFFHFEMSQLTKEHYHSVKNGRCFLSNLN